MCRGGGNFGDLLNCPATAREEALASVNEYPVQDDMAYPLTLEEIVAAIKSIKSGKTPGLDGIPSEIYRYGGTVLHAQLLKFYRICWTAKALPQQFNYALILQYSKRRVTIVTVGIIEAFRYSQLRGNSGKHPSEETIDHSRGGPPRKQCGCCRSRSTIDMIGKSS